MACESSLFFFSSRRRHTRCLSDWSSDVCSSDLVGGRKKSQDLFRYEDKNGNDFDIKSNHINEYLDNITSDHEKVTAKDFRTWAATWKAAFRLSEQLDQIGRASCRERV